MKQSTQFIIGILVFLVVVLLTASIGGLLGAGTNSTGYIIIAIALMCSIMVICTSAIIETMKEHRK